MHSGEIESIFPSGAYESVESCHSFMRPTGMLEVPHELEETAGCQPDSVASAGAAGESMMTATDRAVAKPARDGIFILDSESDVIVEVNPFLSEILGCSREDLVGKPVGEVGLLGYCLRCNMLLEGVRREGHCHCGSVPLKTRDGRRIFADVFGSAYHMDDRTMFLFNVGDVRERP